MKTFLCALAILLLLILLMLCGTRYALRESARRAAAAAAQPRAGEAGCLPAAKALEEHWRRMRRIVGLAVHIRTVEQIDCLVISLRVAAAEGAAVHFEVNRALLIEALDELEMLMRCRPEGLLAIADPRKGGLGKRSPADTQRGI